MEALDKAMVFTGQGIITGALTTACAFLAMGLTNFKGIQEMGIISGGGLVLCLVPMMTLLPVLLMRGRRATARLLQPAAKAEAGAPHRAGGSTPQFPSLSPRRRPSARGSKNNGCGGPSG